MVFKRFVEVGRVALINGGPDEGKVCVIVDVIDQKRALIHGPCTGVRRQAIIFKKLNLLDFKIRIPHSARETTLRKAYEKADITAKWQETSYAKRLAQRTKRRQLTDFDRFKLMILKREKSRLVRGQFKKLKKGASE